MQISTQIEDSLYEEMRKHPFFFLRLHEENKHGYNSSEETYLYYNQEGKLVMPHTDNSITDDAWPKVVLKDSTSKKDIWIAGKGLAPEGSVIDSSNPESYMYVRHY